MIVLADSLVVFGFWGNSTFCCCFPLNPRLTLQCMGAVSTPHTGITDLFSPHFSWKICNRRDSHQTVLQWALNLQAQMKLQWKFQQQSILDFQIYISHCLNWNWYLQLLLWQKWLCLHVPNGWVHDSMCSYTGLFSFDYGSGCPNSSRFTCHCCAKERPKCKLNSIFCIVSTYLCVNSMLHIIN